MNPEEQEKKPPLEQTLKPIKSLRTYQGDVQEAIVKNNYSSKDIFLAEQNKKRGLVGASTNPENPELKNKLYFIFGVIFLVLGLGIVGAVYLIRAKETTTVERKTKALISFSAEKTISVATTTRESFLSELILDKSNFNLPVNSILYINTVDGNNRPEIVENVLALLAPRMPGTLARSFAPRYMLGVFSFDKNEPFIILTTDDYALSFAGMLRWEKDMVSDLGRLMNISQNASTTPYTFVDQERRNKDLRVMKNEKNEIILLYSFLDDKTLLIARNENVFTAILSRYQLTQQAK